MFLSILAQLQAATFPVSDQARCIVIDLLSIGATKYAFLSWCNPDQRTAVCIHTQDLGRDNDCSEEMIAIPRPGREYGGISLKDLRESYDNVIHLYH
jgi:hypothetical protein